MDKQNVKRTNMDRMLKAENNESSAASSATE